MTALLLENIRSVFNVGAIFRTADAVGVSHIFLTGCTPRPIDRMGRENMKLHKTALGAEKTVPWSYHKTAAEVLSVHTEYTPVVVEQTAAAVPYTAINPKNPLYIFGNEVEGVSETVRAAVRTHIHLPMSGRKASLNVSACAAVILYHHTTSDQVRE